MLDAQREACLSAAKAGADVLVGYFRKLDPTAITEKTKNDYVSNADREAEAAIRAELASRFPAYGFLGEESGGSGSTDVLWIVDPLDGTLNFVQGFPHWCVSVALWDAAGPLVGCVLDPLRGDCFLAARGQGATWNGKPMHVSQQAGLDGAFLATGFAYQLGDRWPLFNAALGRVFPRAKGLRRAGSAALDLAHVACGIYDGFFELGLKPWDIAAGALLVTEAGGVLTDWEGHQGWFQSGNLISGTPGVAPELLDELRG
jgi:myo-inositol-1(or 4)-monophosphatase